jgi:hypothetical protein
MDWTTRVQFSAGEMKGFCSLRHHVQTGSGAHPTSYPAEVKWPMPEAGHSNTSEVKNA